VGYTIGILAIIPVVVLWPSNISAVIPDQAESWGIDEAAIAAVITPEIESNRYPESISLPSVGIEGDLWVNYTIDPLLQNEAERLLSRHNPDYGVFVAIDPDSGRILAMAHSTRNGESSKNLSMLNTYPAASVSKIITAVATINEDKAGASTVIPFNGKSTSLYRKNVFDHQNHKWTRNYSLSKSFAKSVNSVFGRLGAVNLGGETMLEYAQRLGFNGRFASDIIFGNGEVDMDVNDSWQVAEMASGYTTRNTLSPLHGAVLAATAVNDGNLVAPVIVDSILGPHGVPLYVHEEPARSRVMDESTSRQLKSMMEHTVKSGSARKSFSRFFRGDLAEARAGGKTGSLTGFNPRGRYDWFVGFGEMGDRKIAYAALCINKEKWYVKSSMLARQMLEFYFRKMPELELESLAS
jgi:cell division protein FtsI/penicillin-binding protein 2